MEQHHGSENYFVVGEGLLGESLGGRARTPSVAVEPAVPQFRCSRMGPKGTGKQLGEPNRARIAEAMTADVLADGQMAAGFTYLGQFLDHDLTFDKTGLMENADVSPADLEQARSPSLDLDSLYGVGPQDPGSAKFYSDGLHLKMGDADGGPPGTGFDNRVVDTLPASVPAAQRFNEARKIVTKHYQWMVRTDYLPRICAPSVVTNVFSQGRKALEAAPQRRARLARPV